MINLYPSGYIEEMLHEDDRKFNPEFHDFSKKYYSSADIFFKCFICANRYKDLFVYSVCDDRFYAKHYLIGDLK